MNMPDILASIGLVELKRYDEETLVRRKEICNRYEKALEAYDKALQMHPIFASAYAGKAVVLEQLGKNWEAQYNREQAKQLGYED